MDTTELAPQAGTLSEHKSDFVPYYANGLDRDDLVHNYGFDPNEILQDGATVVSDFKASLRQAAHMVTGKSSGQPIRYRIEHATSVGEVKQALREGAGFAGASNGTKRSWVKAALIRLSQIG